MSTLAFKRNRFTPTSNTARHKLARFNTPQTALQNQSKTYAGSLIALVSAGIAVCVLFISIALAPVLKGPTVQLVNLWEQVHEPLSKDLHWITICGIAFIYLLSGMVKGLSGIGMGLIAVPLLSVIYNPVIAIATIAVPLIVTNFWQGIITGNCQVSMRKYSVLVISMAITMLIVSYKSSTVPTSFFSILLGLMAITFAIINFRSSTYSLVVGSGKYSQVSFGVISGIAGGLTGLAVIPLVFFMVCSGARKDDLCSTLGLLLFISGISLLLGLSLNQTMTADLFIYSCLATIPALLGVAVGEKLRKLVNEYNFRKLVLILMLAIGVKVLLVEIPTSFKGLSAFMAQHINIEQSTAALPN